MQVGVQFYQTFLVKADDAVPDFFEDSSWLVREKIRLLLNTFPITLSKERNWGLSVSEVLVFQWEGDWQDVFGVALSVKETQSEVRVERVEVDLRLSLRTLVGSFLMSLMKFQLNQLSEKTIKFQSEFGQKQLFVVCQLSTWYV